MRFDGTDDPFLECLSSFLWGLLRGGLLRLGIACSWTVSPLLAFDGQSLLLRKGKFIVFCLVVISVFNRHIGLDVVVPSLFFAVPRTASKCGDIRLAWFVLCGLFNEVLIEVDASVEVGSQCFVGQNPSLDVIEVLGFNAIDKVSYLTSRVDTGISMAGQVLKNLMLIDVSLDIFFKVPASALTSISGVLELAFGLIGEIVDVILAKIVPFEADERSSTITRPTRVAHVCPTVLISEQGGKLVPHEVVVVLVGLSMHRGIVPLRWFEMGSASNQLFSECSVVCFRIVSFSWYVDFLSDDISEGNLRSTKNVREIVFDNLDNTGPASAGLDIGSIRFTVVLLVLRKRYVLADIRDSGLVHNQGATRALLVAEVVAHELEVILGLHGHRNARVGFMVVNGSTWATSDLADVTRFVIGQKGKVFRSIVALGVHDVGRRVLGEPKSLKGITKLNAGCHDGIERG